MHALIGGRLSLSSTVSLLMLGRDDDVYFKLVSRSLLRIEQSFAADWTQAVAQPNWRGSMIGTLCSLLPSKSALVTMASRARAPHPLASASVCCWDRLCQNNFSSLCVAAIKCHSPATFSRPRSRNLRRPLASLIWPFTGSTIALSWA